MVCAYSSLQSAVLPPVFSSLSSCCFMCMVLSSHLRPPPRSASWGSNRNSRSSRSRSRSSSKRHWIGIHPLSVCSPSQGLSSTRPVTTCRRRTSVCLCFSAMCLRLRSGMVSSSKYRTVLQSIFSTQYGSWNKVFVLYSTAVEEQYRTTVGVQYLTVVFSTVCIIQ